ncbi:MAG TPA: gamma-glutamyltransferase [Acidobacteriota bacterium]|nr:gamma-glutamyltransferase [Acidobacteriota bacterium]
MLRIISLCLLLMFGSTQARLVQPLWAQTNPGIKTISNPVRARNGIAVSTSPIASQIGVDILKRGGNAVDAAIAMAFGLQVTYPSAGNIGGGGFMLIRMADGRTTAIDFRETAPAAATPEVYLDKSGNVIPEASTVGLRAVAVPGTVAGLALAHQKFGTRKWAELLDPACRVAKDGFQLGYGVVRSLARKQKTLERFSESRRIYLKNGQLWNEFDLFQQPELAATLARIRDQGPREFYEGKTAQLIVAEMKRGNGLITLEDLKAYKPVEREVLRGTYRGYEILTMPPPSSGGVALLEMLNTLENRTLTPDDAGSSETVHLMVETMRRAFADRAEYLGDPDFVKVPVAALTSKKYAADLFRTINPEKATASDRVQPGNVTLSESKETTHFSVVDRMGNAVSCTYTLNGSYGSGLTVTGGGFLLNNEIDDFAVKVGVPNEYKLIQKEANLIAPHKRPLSSMTPTIVLKDGKLFCTVGSPGGPTIINSVLQVIVNVIDFKMNIQEAVDVPRFHHQWLPDQIEYEPRVFSLDVRRALQQRGHRLSERTEIIGDAHAILIEPETGVRLGAADPRNFGKAVGY